MTIEKAEQNFVVFIYGSIILFALLTSHPAEAEANLILNPGFENTGANGLPVDWAKGNYGTNSALFDYPVAGVGDSKAARVRVSAYTSGDAKWAFKDVAVIPGKEYEFSSTYSSDIGSYITVQFRKSDGSLSWTDIANPSASAEFTTLTARFVVPANVQSVTVFHLIKNVGSLTTDNLSLTEVSAPPPPPSDPANLIQNPSLETANASGLPANWLTGRFGSNTASFIYPVAGSASARAARVSISNYVSGDAKWYFSEISVASGESYSFSDEFKSNSKSYITAQFRNSDGNFSYLDIGTVNAASNWQRFETFFTIPAGVTQLTIFHLIKSDGILEVDNYSLKKTFFDPTHFDKGYISLNFDDGWLSTFQNAIPILDSAGFKSTQFIVTGRMNPQFPAYVQPDQVLQMQSSGHEIGAHGRTHDSLTLMSPAEAEQQIAGSRSDLLQIGVTPANFFSYPFGDYNDAVKQIVRDAGFKGARSSDGGMNLKNSDPYALKRQSVTSATTLGQMESYVSEAISQKAWSIIVFHEINDSRRQYSTSPAIFSQFVDYLKQNNITPITMDQGFSLINN
ncbi:polysaccharide deacetylase family protein [Candidatus Giovannonibacteria bacterium]|nr:polysaccharide deacetylase family protein [Candidatus Giovannonibacteria bacterium]